VVHSTSTSTSCEADEGTRCACRFGMPHHARHAAYREAHHFGHGSESDGIIDLGGGMQPPLPPGPRPRHLPDRPKTRVESDMELQAIAALERQEAKTKAALQAKAEAERCAHVAPRSPWASPSLCQTSCARCVMLTPPRPVQHVRRASCATRSLGQFETNVLELQTSSTAVSHGHMLFKRTCGLLLHVMLKEHTDNDHVTKSLSYQEAPVRCADVRYAYVCGGGRQLEMEAKKAEEAIRAARRKAEFEAAAREQDAALHNNGGTKQPTDVVRPLRAAGSDDDDESGGGGGGGAEGVPWGADGPPSADAWDADMPEALRRRVRADTGDAVELGGGSFAEADGDDGPSDPSSTCSEGQRCA
jgi:hypothetical protein